MVTSLKLSGKDGQISNLRSNNYLWWKFGENRSSRSWESFAQTIIKNKEINAHKTYGPRGRHV